MGSINLGATCDNCKNKACADDSPDVRKKKLKFCRPCMSKNGHPGWDPAEGVKVIHSVDTQSRRPVRRVV